MMLDTRDITGRQIAAARTLIGMTQAQLAQASQLSVFTVRRIEGSDGPPPVMIYNVIAVRLVLEEAGIVFLPATSDSGIGIRLKKSA